MPLNYLSCFCHGSKNNTQESLIYAKLIIYSITPNLEFSPYYEVIYRSATFKLAKNIKVKAKWSTVQCIQYFLSFFYFFHPNGPDNKCTEVVRVIFHTHETVASVLACVHVTKCIKWRRLIHLWKVSVDTKSDCYKITEYSMFFV